MAPEDNDPHCRSEAVYNSLLQLDLDWHIVLIFQEFISDQEKTIRLIIPRWLR
jgi:hypothetical protein